MDTLTQTYPPSIVLADTALLLDIDGTLIDIAPRPDDVFVPTALRRCLEALYSCTNGALALVSGRQLSDIDRLFAPLKLAAVGGHGAEIRPVPNGPVDASHAYPLDPELIERLAAVASGRDGVLVENKNYSLALHYRLAPEQEDNILQNVERICADWPAETIGILPGKFVVEIKHVGINKGLAISKLMTLPPFAGRTPVFIGDDITDETAISALPEFDGMGFSVGRSIPGAVFKFQNPTDVRAWLQRICDEQC